MDAGIYWQPSDQKSQPAKFYAHTYAPWKYTVNSKPVNGKLVFFARLHTIPVIDIDLLRSGEYITPIEVEANAKLASSAPSLFDCLNLVTQKPEVWDILSDEEKAYVKEVFQNSRTLREPYL